MQYCYNFCVNYRCKRIIIVLSKDYVNSEDDLLKWHMYFAHALEPAAQRMNKMIPIRVDRDVKVPGNIKPVKSMFNRLPECISLL